MGKKLEFNWVLKLKNHNLDGIIFSEGTLLSFSKNEERVYPTNIPIMLADEDWNIIAAIEITKYSISDNKTAGKYKILRIFNEQEREVLTKVHRELYSN